ncbi:hypothetical protein MKY07_01785 [Solibacillus sp. FSL W7-1472]|uniref:hypothetical protein n=1 Tax=Solibacillus sp. FSL W7-1472 TaxID=2921707 RepID=UPI0030DBB7C1
MGKVYSAQNVAAYIIYELNDVKEFVNACAIQQILADVNTMWQHVFGHSAFSEQAHDLATAGYVIKEVAEEYRIHGTAHILSPAREWFLKYGEFQLVERPYAVPDFSAKEEIVMTKILTAYRLRAYNDINVAV